MPNSNAHSKLCDEARDNPLQISKVNELPYELCFLTTVSARPLSCAMGGL